MSRRADLPMLAGRALVALQCDGGDALRLAVAARSPSVRARACGSTTRRLAVSVLLSDDAPQEGQVVSEPRSSGGTA